ncbi:hypothetical protein [Tessaracoccus sp. G1721]
MLWGALLLASLVVFAAAHLLMRPPSSYQAVEGPAMKGVSTEGVFRPGGYIDIEFHPGIASIKGHYRGTADVRVYPLSDDDAGPWLDVQMPVGRDWPNSFSGDPDERDFTVEHRVYLSHDDVRAGEAEMVLDYQLFYPVDAGPGTALTSYFKNVSSRENVSLTIQLSDEPLTPDEVAWMDRTRQWSGAADILGAVALTVGISSLLLLVLKGFVR